MGQFSPCERAAGSKAAAGTPEGGAELQERSDETSGLERGARTGKSPVNSKPPVLGCPDERIIEGMSFKRP
jgi:hypothetical protein